jgi:hypothetical protein
VQLQARAPDGEVQAQHLHAHGAAVADHLVAASSSGLQLEQHDLVVHGSQQLALVWRAPLRRCMCMRVVVCRVFA